MVTTERYWNTWHPESCSRMEHLPTGFSIIPGAFSEAESAYSQFPFDNNMRLYEHEMRGRYCRLRGVHAQAEFEIEYLKADPWTVLLRMTETKPPREWGIRYHMLVSLGFEDAAGQMYADPDGSVRGKVDNYSIAVRYAGEPPYDAMPAPTSDAVGLAMADKGYKSTISAEEQAPSWVTCRYVLEQSPQVCLAVSIAHDDPTAAARAEQATRLFENWDARKAEALRAYPSGSDACHSGMTEAVSEVMAWNAMYSKEIHRAYHSIAKTWNRNFGGWYLFFSDSCYQLLMATASGDVEMAEQNLDYALSAATADGNFAGMLSPYQKWVDRTQPPVLGFCLWMHYLWSGDLHAVERAYPVLRRAQDWYLSRRCDGEVRLIRLGTSPTGDGSYRGTKLAAKNETAMDNSPMYDEASFDRKTGLLEMYDVGISSQLALDIECTAQMAELLGREEEASALRETAAELRRDINRCLWNEADGIYANRHLDGRFGLTSPTSFYPLAAGVPDEARLEASIGHIFDPAEFFTECPLIAINAKDPSARENCYWRGRTWAPQSFWTYLGLRRFGREEEAHKLADRAVCYFEKHWTDERRSFENYNPFTGEGTDTVDSQPFYSWTALLPLIWSLEQFGVTPWDGFYFGMHDGSAFTQRNRYYQGRLYDAVCDGGITTLSRSGHVIFRSDIPARFCHFAYDTHSCSVTVTAPREGWVEFPGLTPRQVLVNGESIAPMETVRISAGVSTIQLIL